MKIYLVVSRGGGNHEKVRAVFESRELAEIWMKSKSSPPFSRFSRERPQERWQVVDMHTMDGTPEMNRIVLD
jgi:hypothetical protein